MKSLIERYIYDVTRRLPEKEREEVGKELSSNIYDMLSDDTDEKEIEEVLYQLGSPADLAEKYRQTPRYLISPAIYDEYIRILKIVLPIVGGICLVIGGMLGGVEVIQSPNADFVSLIAKIISNSISMGISAAFQALIWTTVGFVIAERTGSSHVKGKEWSVKDLPEVPLHNKSRISLADSIAELVITVIFTIGALLVCNGLLPFAFFIQKGDIRVYTLFSTEFLSGLTPAIIVISLLGILACAVKIKYRSYTPFVCVFTIAVNLVNTIIVVYLANRPNLFSSEFTAFIQNQDFLPFNGGNTLRLVPMIFSVIVVIITLMESISVIYRTVKNR